MSLPAYYCQGHSTTCPACLDPEFGCEGHGEISYCDGTCASAQDLFWTDLEAHRVTMPAASTETITLQVGGHGRTPESYFVTFEGPDAQAWALAYISARPGFYFTETPLAPVCHTTFPELADTLYPTCHHGLSADLCMDPYGPHHYGTREWEMANEGW